MNPLIALQYETPDFAGAIHRGQQMYAQRQENERANALAAYMQENGAGIMSGDQNALAGLAAYDPQAAMRIQESHTGMANDAARLRLAERETNSSISDRAARLEILRGDAERQAAEHSAKMDAAQRAQTVQTLTTVLPAFQGVQDAETWDRMAGELAPDAVGKFDQRDELFAMGEGMLRGFGGRPEPLSPEGKLAADREAGYDVGTGAAKPTSDMLEYDFARSQGYEGTFQDYQTEMKRAGANSVNVNTGANDYAKERGKAFAGTMGEFEAGERSARDALGSLGVMSEAMRDPNFYSGAGDDTVLALKRTAASLGINPEGVSSMETFNSQSKAAALSSMGGSLGAGFSNADRDFIEGQVPNLGNTPEGNSALIDVQTKIQSRKIEIAQLARDYEAQNGQIDNGFMSQLNQWAEQNPLFETSRNPNARQIGGTTSGGLKWSLD